MTKDNSRASQFMPFNGLKGFTSLIHEAETPKVSKREISEERAEKLDYIIQNLRKGDLVKVTHYTSQGYVTETCEIEEINCPLHYIRTEKECLSFMNIWDIITV